jgi:hypothetical protein
LFVPDAVAVMVSGAVGPGGSDVAEQTIVRLEVVHVHPFPLATGALTPKRLFVIRAFNAAFGPLFVTFSVIVTVPPALTGFGAAIAVSARSAASVMATVALPEAVQEPLVTTMLITALPLAPAVHVIDGVPTPFVIVPPVIDQLYVAPDAAAGTEAVLPEEAAGTEDGAVTVVVVAPLETVTVFDAEPVQPAAVVTVTL